MRKANIFISIAAYREFDLTRTLQSAMSTAAEPERLQFCICWQRDSSESLGEWQSHPQIELIDVPYRDSRGVCWARNLIAQKYRGETYFLQLDGHHRFAESWDAELVNMLESLRSNTVPRPVLTTYLPSYEPRNDPAGRSEDVWLLGADRFDDSGVVFMRPYILAQAPQAPVPTRFWSAHFSFSDGRFLQDVPTDPEGYFHGEEISNCVRGWTHGYDFFSPHKTLVWHEYSRKGRRCHWDDHPDWIRQNKQALERYRLLLGVDGVPRQEPEGFGLGTLRSLPQYEQFAGISFAHRTMTADTLANEPPEPSSAQQLSSTLESAPSLRERVPRRSSDWTDELLDDELVVYHKNSTAVCYLNESASIVWRLIDGERSVDEICELIEGAYGEVPSLEKDVALTLSELRSQRAIIL